MKDNFLDELNESQRLAVTYNNGASLVIAGAGSGKTRVLTYKIAYLLKEGYRPDSILALTFTNKAAKEMKSRIGRLVGADAARRLWMGTFHSVFLRILRHNAALLNYDPEFTIYDADDSKSLVRTIIRECGLDDKTYTAGRVIARISMAKNHLILPQDYDNSYELMRDDEQGKIGEFHRLYHIYQDRCKTAGAMDFDDLLVNTYLLFKGRPDILAMYQDMFQYVLVDEYQDTNFVQHEIILQLGKKHQHVCVVGDDAQSIYSFRGANIDNILSFQNDFTDTKLFKLEQNYRSTQNIVLAANSLIEKNQRQIKKSIFSEKDKGELIPVYKAYSDIEEAMIVVKGIQKLRRKENLAYQDFAVLYRTNAQSRVFEETLRKSGLPYRIYGGLSFYQRKEIKDVIAYFRLIVNPHDEEALRRVINYPARGIGDTTLNKVRAAANNHQVSLWTALNDPAKYGVDLNKAKVATLYEFCELMRGLMKIAADENADEVGRVVITQTGLMNIAVGDPVEVEERKENIGELVTGMADFVTAQQEEGRERVALSDYLSEIMLLTDQDTDKAGEDHDRVTLMTIHAAKGLEFPVVFIVGLEENLFPNVMCMNSEKELEEERRLFYVALTRAEKYCILSYAESRFHFGKMEYARPSRFIKDIDPQYLQLSPFLEMTEKIDSRSSKYRPVFDTSSKPFSESSKPMFDSSKPIHTGRPAGNYKPVTPVRLGTSSQIDPALAERLNVSVGQLIEHERFGVGEVIKIEGNDENRKATIEFRNLGTKILLLRFAKFKVIG
jgi:DNA helicase-2/ATP-dependent DNA helicase PcrA